MISNIYHVFFLVIFVCFVEQYVTIGVYVIYFLQYILIHFTFLIFYISCYANVGYTTAQVNSVLYPPVSLDRVPASGKGGKVTAARQQLKPCDPIWHVIDFPVKIFHMKPWRTKTFDWVGHSAFDLPKYLADTNQIANRPRRYLTDYFILQHRYSALT